MKTITGYVAGTWVQGKFLPIALILKFGGVYKVISNIKLYVDNYGNLTLKPSKFYKEKNAIKEGETKNVSNLLKEFRDLGLEIVEIHSGTIDAENAYDIHVSGFPAPL